MAANLLLTSHFQGAGHTERAQLSAQNLVGLKKGTKPPQNTVCHLLSLTEDAAFVIALFTSLEYNCRLIL